MWEIFYDFVCYFYFFVVVLIKWLIFFFMVWIFFLSFSNFFNFCCLQCVFFLLECDSKYVEILVVINEIRVMLVRISNDVNICLVVLIGMMLLYFMVVMVIYVYQILFVGLVMVGLIVAIRMLFLVMKNIVIIRVLFRLFWDSIFWMVWKLWFMKFIKKNILSKCSKLNCWCMLKSGGKLSKIMVIFDQFCFRCCNGWLQSLYKIVVLIKKKFYISQL